MIPVSHFCCFHPHSVTIPSYYSAVIGMTVARDHPHVHSLSQLSLVIFSMFQSSFPDYSDLALMMCSLSSLMPKCRYIMAAGFCAAWLKQ